MEGATDEVMTMAGTAVLSDSVRHRYDDLSERLHQLQSRLGPPGTCEGPHRGCAPIDEFLAAASRHLHAVNEVLVPRVRRLPGGRDAVRDHLAASRVLEVALAHAKAHEYGSVYEQGYSWASVWTDIEEALPAVRRTEERLVELLAENGDADALEELARRLEAAEPSEPTRPHPYLPHTGVLGAASRRLARATDAFWDATEGRMLAAPRPEPRKRPGLLGQYLLGNPRLDEDR